MIVRHKYNTMFSLHVNCQPLNVTQLLQLLHNPYLTIIFSLQWQICSHCYCIWWDKVNEGNHVISIKICFGLLQTSHCLEPVLQGWWHGIYLCSHLCFSMCIFLQSAKLVLSGQVAHWSADDVQAGFDPFYYGTTMLLLPFSGAVIAIVGSWQNGFTIIQCGVSVFGGDGSRCWGGCRQGHRDWCRCKCRGRCQRKGNVNLWFFIIWPILPPLPLPLHYFCQSTTSVCAFHPLGHDLSHETIMWESFVFEQCCFWMFLASDQLRNRGGRGRQTDCKIFLKNLLSLDHYVKTFFIIPGTTRQILEYGNSIVFFFKLETMSLWVWSCVEGYSMYPSPFNSTQLHCLWTTLCMKLF